MASELNEAFYRSVELSEKEAFLRNEANLESVERMLRTKGRTDAADKAENILVGMEGLLCDLAAGVDDPYAYRSKAFKAITKEYGYEVTRIVKRILNARLHQIMQHSRDTNRTVAETEKLARMNLKRIASKRAINLDLTDSIYVSESEMVNLSGMKVLYKNHSSSFNRTGVCYGFFYHTAEDDIYVNVQDAAYKGAHSFRNVKFMSHNDELQKAFTGYLSYIRLYKETRKATVEAEMAVNRMQKLQKRLDEDKVINDFSFERQKWFLFKDREMFVDYVQSFSTEFRLLAETILYRDAKSENNH